MSNNNCTYDNLKAIYLNTLAHGYKIVTCRDYFINHLHYDDQGQKILINRIDIDLSLEKADKIIRLLNGFPMTIPASFFIRLHAREYNPFSFENFLILQKMARLPHEIGLHCEPMDCSKIWSQDEEVCFMRDIDLFRVMMGKRPLGIASHGSGLTGMNNLDFWKKYIPKRFGLLYEAYDPILFDNLYCSIGFVGWKTYQQGKLLESGKCVCDYIDKDVPVIYLTLHPIMFYERHCYE